MKFDNSQTVDQLVWNMRLADLPRDENRTIINRLFNGDPPFDETEAEENQVQVNRNDLTGVNAMAQARRQWIQAFLKPGNFWSVNLDFGPPHKRTEYSHTITRHANRVLRRSRRYMEQSRATGGNVLLHGIGPCTWRSRRDVVPTPLPISSVMIPSETDIDFENLPYFAIFQELTPAQLYDLTKGPRRDPGWNMPLVDAQIRYVADQIQKQPNASAFQYMPSRIEELNKQDMGMWGSDAVPTIDYWDFYFRKEENGPIYRRIILDWGLAETDLRQYKPGSKPQNKKAASLGDKEDEYGGFLYTSGDRKFADSFSQVLHCNFGDCSAVFPQKYHSVRSMGWMLWGVCDLENRLHCKFTEALFEQLMWFFRTASNEQLKRLQRADWFHMGVIPDGVRMVTKEERFTPDAQFVQMGFARFRQLMSENAASFMQDFDKGQGKEMTATETMARVNAVNAMVSGMFTLAYIYEEYKDREVLRRLLIPGNSNSLARDFRLGVLKDGVPEEALDIDRMEVTRERAMGGGNKTLEMAEVQFLQGIRKNLNPDAQRKVDHIAIESATDDARLAEELAPMQGATQISSSMRDAQDATPRLLQGLPFPERPDMVLEDYVKVWLIDLTLLVKKALQSGGMAPADQIAGMGNLAGTIDQYIKTMGANPDEKQKVREYEQQLTVLNNQIKAFAQRLATAMKARNGQAAGADPREAAKAQAMVIQAQTKAQLAAQSHAQKTAQRQISFDLEQQRKEREHASEMRRLAQESDHRALDDTLHTLREHQRQSARAVPEPEAEPA